MNFTKNIILPKDKDQKDYIIFLYKNRNNYHNMKDEDINNLMKLMNIGKLEKNDYPVFKKSNRVQSKLEGFTI